MDIIAAHQQGLIEQLEEEVLALAGRPLDHGQRAVVLHHLYDHSRGAHGWALIEARRGLRIAAGIAALGRRVERWGWVVGGGQEARGALSALAEALGEAARARTAAAYRAYRLSATAALRSEAERSVPTELLDALDACHAARRARKELDPDIRQALADASDGLANAAVDSDMLERAWAMIRGTKLNGAARRLLGDAPLARKATRDRRRGWVKVESTLLAETSLPATFGANPAQHFYALQQMLRERRRQQWREACDQLPDAVALAA
ncbi:MAG: hypothetical protein ACJ8FJ_10925 [Sphingomicrobium sp.]